MGKDPRRIREEIEATRERMGDTVEAIGYRADVPSRMKENIAEKVGSVKDKISDGMDAVKARLGGFKDNVSEAVPSRDDVKRATSRAVDIARENPLGLVLGGVALGFMAGLLIPTTRAEAEAVRPLAENVKQMAQDAGHSVSEHGKQMLHEMAAPAKEAAQRHGQQLASELRDRVGGAASSGGAGRSSSDATDYAQSTPGYASQSSRGPEAP
ncbi:MAG: DUF3618 domain-containing protein [Candidatus Eremiobacteraeota bacterium]|nr:DUF3618 domain-containing protein [Candidatus Eremiobacteraeota bacterium]